MIQEALQYTKTIFNQFVKNKFKLDEEIVLVNKLVDQNGVSPLENKNKIIVSIIHIEQETVKQFYNRKQKTANGSYINQNPAQRYNIYILVSPNFDNYNETLKFLTTTIQFFQVNEVLDARTTATIPAGLEKLEFDIQKGEGYMQMQNLWTALGAKYQPSVIYNMKLVTVATDEIEGFNKQVSTISNQVQP